MPLRQPNRRLRKGSKIVMALCVDCGRLREGEPTDYGHRHAEGAAALGVYYDERRVVLRVESVGK